MDPREIALPGGEIFQVDLRNFKTNWKIEYPNEGNILSKFFKSLNIEKREYFKDSRGKELVNCSPSNLVT